MVCEKNQCLYLETSFGSSHSKIDSWPSTITYENEKHVTIRIALRYLKNDKQIIVSYNL